MVIRIVGLTAALVASTVSLHGTASETCSADAMALFTSARSAEAELRQEEALTLYSEATALCDSSEYWQAYGDSLAKKMAEDSTSPSADGTDDSPGAMEAYGRAFSAARRERNEIAGSQAARSMAEVGLAAGDPIKANEWLLVAKQLDPDNEEIAVLQEEVDSARNELSSEEIDVGFSQTRGLGRVNNLLAGGAAASDYWESAAAEEDPSVNRLEAEPLEESGGAGEATISIPINFESNSVELTPQSVSNIENLAKALAARPDSSNIVLIGHADVRGEADYNLRLSEERAEHVMELLSDLEPSLAGRIQATGKGETQPVDQGESERGHANNRRLEVRVSG